ncbi:Endo/exonuclease/phosphatase domain-containing protein [Mycena indigotica]|uniref:Endo/exonuclease/phosphatase domain-containing protein n=1 Tax=Mycena indigotica TaxID=2126181 RepID=A0A8H6VRH4_9AGAR|nr:Endo/exonuclease/phosphatase domain-containing protein [Mycena indigotica]KAF7291347.1 Endo/exonuclease/phosphatase domain-containing protein [Mycena indigotica]
MQLQPNLAPSTGIRFVTYNLRYDTRPDNVSVTDSLTALPSPLPPPADGYLPRKAHEEHRWSLRRMRVAEQVLGGEADVVCVQEALVRQVNDLSELFGTNWAWVGVGRDDGQEAGEFSAIFYKKSLFQVLSSDYFWLSPTPFVAGSRYPDAGSVRICTTLRLRHLSHPKRAEFTVMNTHLDERSNGQRKLAGGSMLLARAKYESYMTAAPVFVLGDFNSPPEGNDSAAYKIVTGTRSPEPLPQDFAERFRIPADGVSTSAAFILHDLRATTPRRAVSVNHATFTGFTAPNDTSAWSRIDFVFAGGEGWQSTAYRVVDARSDDGVLASDHRPVFVDIQI